MTRDLAVLAELSSEFTEMVDAIRPRWNCQIVVSRRDQLAVHIIDFVDDARRETVARREGYDPSSCHIIKLCGELRVPSLVYRIRR